jgi:hypothetical protein
MYYGKTTKVVLRGVKFGFKQFVTYNKGWGIAMLKRFYFKFKTNLSWRV